MELDIKEDVAQVYSPEDDGITRVPYEEVIPNHQPQADQGLGDTYDLYDMVTQVHSPVPEISRDFTLSDLESEVVQNKLPKFIREQLKTLKIYESYLVIPVEELEKRYDPISARRIHAKLQIVMDDIKQLILNEIYSMVIMSRTTRGKILKAILLHGKGDRDRDEFEEELGRKSVKDKLMEKN